MSISVLTTRVPKRRKASGHIYAERSGGYPERKYMYFGSVKFFRHLILTVVFGWIGIATLLAVFFGVKCHKLENEEKEPMTIEEHISRMTDEGYTLEEIEAVIRRGSSLTAETDIPANAEVTVPEASPASEPAPSETVSETTAVSSETADLSLLYPEMTVTRSGAPVRAEPRDVFLTFEGDPSSNMADLLIILDRQNANAAFFLDTVDCSADDMDTVRLAASRENTLGVLAGTDSSYADAQSYLEDFYALYNGISQISGTAPVLYRIPETAEMTAGTRQEIMTELERRGFVYCDHNVISDDRAPDSGWQEIYDRVTSRVFRNKIAEKGSVVLLHGGSSDKNTVYTVEDIISDMTSQGYLFKAYTENTVI
ncbi:MAG: hypothetical protein ACI4J0_04910 [Huintestinicola sp.]|uniref:hypothetical protein n=1 Tax=Huintestinicola sp. TaxID=2981661 RepID=UPI003EFE71D9